MQKNRRFHVPHPTFLFLLETPLPCDYHAICCMNAIEWKNNSTLAKPLAACIPIYLQKLPSYSNRKCKKSPFSRTAAHIFVSPRDALRLSRNKLHGWKDNSMLAKPLTACTCKGVRCPPIFLLSNLINVGWL